MPTVDENIEVTSPKKKKVKTVPAKVGTVITEQEFTTLDKMLRSNDHGDHTMAQAILNGCNIKESIYWIWRLSKQSANNMVYLRTKASREFRDASGLFTISWMKSTAFAMWLHAKGWMTPEIYSRIKPKILEELRKRNESENLYDIHVTIKDQYKQYDPENTDTVISLTKTNEQS